MVPKDMAFHSQDRIFLTSFAFIYLAQLFGSLSLAGSLCDVFSTVSAFCSKDFTDGRTDEMATNRTEKTKKSKKAKARKQEAKQSKCPPPTSKGSAEAHSTIAKSQR